MVLTRAGLAERINWNRSKALSADLISQSLLDPWMLIRRNMTQSHWDGRPGPETLYGARHLPLPASFLLMALLCAAFGLFLLIAGLGERRDDERIAIEIVLMAPAVLSLLRYLSVRR
jgi:hypothetical protein